MNAFPLYAKKVVATGKLENYTRADLIALLTELGAIPICQVSSRTDFLLVGSKPGKKLRKACDLDVQIITESEFEQMLAQACFLTEVQLCLSV